MRKEFYGILPLALTSCLASQATAQEKQTQRPNVVFIYADDIGYGDLSCNGAKTIHTPNVERLAKMGVRFTNAHSAAATSTPSRYAMLTGEYAWRKAGTGIAAGDAAAIIRSGTLYNGEPVQGCRIQHRSRRQMAFGTGRQGRRTRLNKPLQPGTNDIGFEYSFIMAAYGRPRPCVFVENDQVINLDPNDPIQVSYKANFPGEPTGKDNPELLKMHPSHGHDQSIVNGISRIGYMKGGKSALWQDEKIAETLTGKAVSFIEGHKSAPFFLYFATQDAHVPRVPSPQFAGKSGMGPRGDCLLEFDWSVGEILNALERLGLDKNTLVILSSDNGPVVDDGYKDQAVELLGDHTPGGIYRGGKYSSFEAGTRIPCIWSWQGVIRPGTVSDALLCQIDWFAYICRMLNVRLPEGAAPDSEPMLKAWTGKQKKGREWLVLQNAQNNLSVTDGRWKYLRPGNGPAYLKAVNIELGNSKEPQLYDLKKDPKEKINVAGQNPELVKKMAAQLEKIVDGRYGLPL